MPAPSEPAAGLIFVGGDRFLPRWCLAKFLLVLGLTVLPLLRAFVLTAYEWRQGYFELLQGAVGTVGVLSTVAGPPLMRLWSTEVVFS